jgi:hypothetical protein
VACVKNGQKNGQVEKILCAMTRTSLPPELPTEPVYRLSVEQFHEMLRSGILTKDDPLELLDGWLVPKMMKNPPQGVVQHHGGQRCSENFEPLPEPEVCATSDGNRDAIRETESEVIPTDMAAAYRMKPPRHMPKLKAKVAVEPRRHEWSREPGNWAWHRIEALPPGLF